jgi:AcrR family transcriptional regulator
MSISAPTKPMRSDGVEARNRLLDASMRLFAEQGFAKTSTRDIAEAAQVNISAISYYFGDKAGLYRAVFIDPRTNPDMDTAIDAVLRQAAFPRNAGTHRCVARRD